MGHDVTNHGGHLGRGPQNPTHGHSVAILGSSDLHGDSWRQVGREEKHLQPQTAPCILAGHRQLLALCLFIPDLRCPFYFPPFKTWPGPRHCYRKHGPRDLSDGALTPGPWLTNHSAAVQTAAAQQLGAEVLVGGGSLVEVDVGPPGCPSRGTCCIGLHA